MNLLKFIFLVLLVSSIFFFLFHFEKLNKEEKRLYYLCQDNHTKEFLVPLTPYQYENIAKNYVYFASMYLCNERYYTRYHLQLIKKNK